MRTVYYYLFIGVYVTVFTRASPSRWDIGVYSLCSKTCGRGTQSRSVKCVDVISDTPASEWTCPLPKPSSIQSCAIIPCAPEWQPEKWGECSKTCGRGFQTRKFNCKQHLANGELATVSSDYCPRRRPTTRKKCGLVDCPPKYIAKKWSPCLSTCGSGIQFREIVCVRIRAEHHHHQTVATSFCQHLPAPESKRKCNAGKCPGVSGKFVSMRTRKKRLLKARAASRRRALALLRRRVRPTKRQRVSPQRRSTSLEKGRTHRCGLTRTSQSHSRRASDSVLLPCLREEDFRPKSPPRPIPAAPAGRQALRKNAPSKFTRPFIVSPGDDGLPVKIAGEIITYVGGTLTVSDTDTVTILCEASGFPLPITEWLKDGESLDEDDRHALLRDRSLRIIRPFIYDGGNYTCVARNFIGSYSASTILSVAKKPRIISSLRDNDYLDKPNVMSQIGTVIRASPGASIRIKCPVEGFPPPRVRWQKDVAGLGENARVLADNSLEIDLAGPVDQGLYNCEATNPIGTDYRSSTLLLFEAPKLQEFLTSKDIPIEVSRGLPRLLMASNQRPVYKIDMGASALVGCPVTGLGEVDMSWTMGRQPIELSLHDSKYKAIVDGKVLFLENVDENSQGVYSCHSSNVAGNLTASLEIGIANYSWHRGAMGECSHTCGGSGFQEEIVKCVREGKEPVDDWRCDSEKKMTPHRLPCNRVKCPPRFHVGPWSACSSSCGIGSRRRKVACRVQNADNSYTTVDASQCSHVTTTQENTPKGRPRSVESCTMRNCPRWATGSWSQCGDKCYGMGMGIRTRRVYCLDGTGKRTSVLHCMQSERPKWREICFTMKCEPVWIVSKWSSCSRTCGSDGIHTRILNCVYRGNRRQRAGPSCDAKTRPPVTKRCTGDPCGYG